MTPEEVDALKTRAVEYCSNLMAIAPSIIQNNTAEEDSGKVIFRNNEPEITVTFDPEYSTFTIDDPTELGFYVELSKDGFSLYEEKPGANRVDIDPVPGKWLVDYREDTLFKKADYEQLYTLASEKKPEIIPPLKRLKPGTWKDIVSNLLPNSIF